MSLGRALMYHLNVDILGRAALRLRRWQAERRARSGAGWNSEFVPPPLDISPRTKELIGRHYLKGNFAHLQHKVAWVTSGAPVEFLKALDFYVLYPENHGALCGAMRAAESLCVHADQAGYSRDLCSYARTDIGSALSGQSPV